MIDKNGLRNLWESSGPENQRGRVFLDRFRNLLGVCDAKGREHRDHLGRLQIKPAACGDRLRTSEVSIKALCESILGEGGSQQLSGQRVRASRDLLEQSGGAILPSAFANINAFTAATAGLLEVAILEGYQLPTFIADQLMPTEESKLFDGKKFIGATNIKDDAEVRLPGQPTARARIGEKWVTAPPTVENALAVEVSQEAVFLDLTGTILEMANNVGEYVAYRKELRVIDAFIGVTNTYNYKGNGYNTYLTSGSYVNKLTGNELIHPDNVQAAKLLFRDMVDPETGRRFNTQINPTKILINEGKGMTARSIFGDTADGYEYRDTPGATSGPQKITKSTSPYKGQFDVIMSSLVYQRMTDADGLNLSPANADKYWFMWQPGKSFKYLQNWPLRVQTATPGDLEMTDRGLILFVKADERGTPVVIDPRYAVLCTN